MCIVYLHVYYIFNILHIYCNMYTNDHVKIGIGPTPWWAVDLSRSFDVYKVYIYQECRQS